MEDLLDLYEEPYDPQFPTVCFDELPYQLTDEVRSVLDSTTGAPARSAGGVVMDAAQLERLRRIAGLRHAM